jgi:hypothetical protein
MAWQVESNTCAAGGGFEDVSPGGFLAKLGNFLRRPINAGTPIAITTWASIPSIGIANNQAYNFSVGSEISLSVAGGGSLPSPLVAGTHYWIGEIAPIGGTAYLALYDSYYDAVTYGATTGQGRIHWTDQGSGTCYIGTCGNGAAYTPIAINTAAGAITNMIFQDTNSAPMSKVVQISTSSHTGQVLVQFFMGVSGANVPQCCFAGYLLNVSTSIPFAYDFRAGKGCLIIQSNSTGTMLATTGINTCGVDQFTKDTVLTDVDDLSNTTTSAVSASTDYPVIPIADTSWFTEENYYFIVNNDFSKAEYVQCLSINPGVSITVPSLFNSYDAGAYLGSYPFPYYAFGDAQGGSGDNNVCFSNSGACSAQIPLFSSPFASGGNYVIGNQTSPIKSGVCASVMANHLRVQNPDGYGNNAVQQPLIGEKYRPNDGATTQMNRSWGIANNIFFCADSTLTEGTTTIAINEKVFKYFRTAAQLFAGGESDLAVLFQDTQEDG